MSTKKPFCIMLAILLSISVLAISQSATTNVTAKSSSQVTSMSVPPDPPTTRLIREYVLPAIPFATAVYLGPARTPFDVAYDSNGYAWVTDIARDTIYRLTPATFLNQTLTSALQWVLPDTTGKRSPLYIISDDAAKVVWFTNPTSHQISRLNWTNNQLDDWNLANLNVIPLELVMQSSNIIWFTGLNDSRFFQLQVNTNTVTSYTIRSVGGAPVAIPTRITFNGTYLFMTDFVYDRLYEVPLPAPAQAFSFPLTHPGFSWDVDVDPSNNAWVTQPQSSLIDEQLAHSVAKAIYTVDYSPTSIPTTSEDVKPNTLNVQIQITAVTPNAYSGPLNTTGDPFKVWSIPTGMSVVTYLPPPAKPWDVAASADGYAWFTEPLYNHVGVIQPSTGAILLYAVPTSQSSPLSMDVQPGSPSSDYHVWFTEYHAGQIGELFNSTLTFDMTVCPSIPSQYSPPPPGSIRWTTSEIWFNSHSAPLTGVPNTLHARIENLGPTAVSNITVRFYWYSNTTSSIGYNYIPLPPGIVSSGSWTLIGTTHILFSMAPGSTFDAPSSWIIPAAAPTNFTIGVQVSVSGDCNVYNNVAYANFTSVSPTAPPAFTAPGIAAGFIGGAIAGGLIIGVLRRPQIRVSRKAAKM